MEEIESGPVKTRRFSQRQYQLVALVTFVFVGLGLVLWSLGVFKSDPQAQADPDENQTKALAVPEAKNKAMENDKYRNANKDDARFRSEGGKEDANLGAVLGQQRTDRQTTNELLDVNDYQAVESAGQSQQLQSASQRKQQTYRNHQANQRQRAAENRRLADPNAGLFVKSREEIAEEQRDAKDRDMNQRTADLLLSRMESMPVQGGGAMPVATASMATAGAANAPAAKTGSGGPKGQGATVMHGEISRNTIGQPNNSKGFFYNVSRQNTRRSYSGNDAIRAVVHGQGSEGITVQTGSTAKVRLEQNTVFNLAGEDVMLPKGTLLNGICTVGDDRVFITVSSLVMGDAIYLIQVQAFDLDGLQGIHVPNLAEKNQIARRLSRAATSTANSGTGYVISQGGVGQQVATQVATQGARGLMQGARQLVQNRASQPRVTIRANYQILLKSAELTPTSAPSVSMDDY